MPSQPVPDAVRHHHELPRSSPRPASREASDRPRRRLRRPGAAGSPPGRSACAPYGSSVPRSWAPTVARRVRGRARASAPGTPERRRASRVAAGIPVVPRLGERPPRCAPRAVTHSWTARGGESRAYGRSMPPDMPRTCSRRAGCYVARPRTSDVTSDRASRPADRRRAWLARRRSSRGSAGDGSTADLHRGSRCRTEPQSAAARRLAAARTDADRGPGRHARSARQPRPAPRAPSLAGAIAARVMHQAPARTSSSRAHEPLALVRLVPGIERGRPSCRAVEAPVSRGSW